MCLKFCLTLRTIKTSTTISDFLDLLKLQEKNKTPGIKDGRTVANFTDSIAKVTKDIFAKDVAKACYFCLL